MKVIGANATITIQTKGVKHMSKPSTGRVRATIHRSRVGKDGKAHSPKHNDRNFDLNGSDHIDAKKSATNKYWHRYQKTQPKLTFEEVEKKFYEEHFSDSLNARNENYRKEGHKDRCKTMDEYRKHPQSCPEEIIWQLGKKGQESIPSSSQLWNCVIDLINWRQKNYPACKTLNIALHLDEPNGVYHIQERVVWVAKDKKGREIVGQGKALESMGITRPDPQKREGRYNNAKSVFTEITRNKFIEICKARGIEIETEPLEPSKRGFDLLQYQFNQEKEKLAEIKKEQEQETEKLAELKAELEKASADPRLKDLKMKERDSFLKEFYPDIWEHINDLANGKDFSPPKQAKEYSRNKDNEIDR